MTVEITAKELSVLPRQVSLLLAAKMPSGIGYRVARLAKVLQTEVNTVIDQQVKIGEKYGEQDKNGDWIIKREAENFEKSKEELEDLLGTLVTINVDPVTIPSNIELEPSVLLALEKFLVVSEV